MFVKIFLGRCTCTHTHTRTHAHSYTLQKTKPQQTKVPARRSMSETLLAAAWGSSRSCCIAGRPALIQAMTHTSSPQKLSVKGRTFKTLCLCRHVRTRYLLSLRSLHQLGGRVYTAHAFSLRGITYTPFRLFRL